MTTRRPQRTRLAAPPTVSGAPGTKEQARARFAPRVRLAAPRTISAKVGGKFSTLPPPPALVVRMRAVPLVTPAPEPAATAKPALRAARAAPADLPEGAPPAAPAESAAQAASAGLAMRAEPAPSAEPVLAEAAWAGRVAGTEPAAPNLRGEPAAHAAPAPLADPAARAAPVRAQVPAAAKQAAAAPIYPDPLRLSAPWDPEADDTLVVRAVRQETHDVKTFVFSPAHGARFAYAPGQFITLDLDVGGEPVNRCYTISSSPTRPDTISITVKRVPGGPVSNHLHDRLVPGSVIRAVGPLGAFSCTQHPAEKYLFLSGGSGVTPLMSMARWHHDHATGADIAFVHAARTPADIVFRGELELMARLQPAFSFVPICERDTAAERWHGFRGRISRALLDAAVPDYAERETFVCGPAPFMNAVKTLLRDAGYDMARHHEESFDFATLAAAEPAVAAEVLDAEAHAPAVAVHRVTFARSNQSIDVPADTFVLEAARRAGIRLPSSCTKGLCGTCKSRILSGSVAMTHGGGIRQREVDAGMALICCSRPTSDLVIDR